jgi:hypothetical protein
MERMAKRRPRRLVVDASVGRSANEPTADERAQQCANFLVIMRAAGHALVLTPDIRAEWHRHVSQFTDIWLRTMFARHLVVVLDLTPDDDFRTHLGRAAQDSAIAAIVLKDALLIEAAEATDGRVVALDDQARHHFRNIANAVHRLRTICWVNPSVADEEPITWLRQGAPLDGHRLLGHR